MSTPSGRGSEGPKGTTLGQYVRVRACATILLGSGSIYLGLKSIYFKGVGVWAVQNHEVEKWENTRKLFSKPN